MSSGGGLLVSWVAMRCVRVGFCNVMCSRRVLYCNLTAEGLSLSRLRFRGLGGRFCLEIFN